MIKPPIPHDEALRLCSLLTLRILDTPSEERFDRITRMAKRMFRTDICLVSLVDSNRQWFKSKQGLDACETSREISFCGHAIVAGEILIVNDAATDERFSDNPLVTEEPHIRFYAGCPIKGPYGYLVGTLCVIDRAPREMTDEDCDTLRELAAMVEDEMRLTAQATVDDLTKVANRRGFQNVASHMLELCRRTGTSAELLFFDLDGFKAINDSDGHAAGDNILKHFAKLLMECFRSADVIARIGGDEFAVLMAGSKGASQIAVARLEKMAKQTKCAVLQKLMWSVGSVEFDATRHADVEALLADADALMYQAKTSGRQKRL